MIYCVVKLTKFDVKYLHKTDCIFDILDITETVTDAYKLKVAYNESNDDPQVHYIIQNVMNSKETTNSILNEIDELTYVE